LFPLSTLWDEVFREWHDPEHLLRVAVRLTAAMVLGGLLGFEREYTGKSAGLRTHMLVAMGSALFVLVPLEAGATPEGVTRVIQGLVAGIGFLGAGTILKLTGERQILGLTTAAGIWLTAAVGMAVGAGWLWIATIGTALALAVLGALGYVERRLEARQKPPPGPN
jgi:putative Mg2+ transporter-C (MgtC) family protein